MRLPAKGFPIEALERTVPTLSHFAVRLFFCLAVCLAARAQTDLPADGPLTARSVSGQFIVSAAEQNSRLFYRRDFAANTNFVRLEPALLAVAAERFKELLWQQLGLKPGSSWSGKIYLTLRPAHSPDDEVTVASGYLLRSWNYHVSLPDVLARTRYGRTLSAVLLLEIANRNNLAGDPSAEIPSWLVAGLAWQVLDEDAAKIILTAQSGALNSLPQNTLNERQRGLDPLASARRTLQNYAALTFDQLSWPTDEQLNGDDDGVYLASAQLFVHELLKLPDGPPKMLTLLDRLHGCQNWQTAFFFAFHDDFQRPVEVEKWWSLRAIDFAAHSASSQWTPADSSDRLANLLSVPVEVRVSSNSLPAHAQISLQTAIRELGQVPRDNSLAAVLRNIELAQFRLAPPFAALAAGYRDTIADFLGELKRPQVSPVDKIGSGQRRATVRDTLRKLDALDLRRRNVVAHMNLRFVPRNVHSTLP
jgi:hypothetical protein